MVSVEAAGVVAVVASAGVRGSATAFAAASSVTTVVPATLIVSKVAGSAAGVEAGEAAVLAVGAVAVLASAVAVLASAGVVEQHYQ